MKKKIDHVYRERFRDLETDPPEESWQHIMAALPREKKRRVLPFWFELAGIAATLALMFTVFQVFSPASNPEVVIPISNTEFKEEPLQVAPASESFQEPLQVTSNLQEERTQRTSESPSEERKSAAPVRGVEVDAVAGSTDQQQGFGDFSNHLIPEPVRSFGRNEIVAEAGMEGLARTAPTEEATGLAATDPFQQLLNGSQEGSEPAITNPEPRSRFSIRTTAGAVYYDNIGGGNAIDPQFADNTSSGEVTMAYGINVAYELSPQVKLRTGVSKVQLSHNTNNIEFAVATRSQSLTSPELTTTVLASSDASNGYLNQTLEFIEIPLEFELALVDKKIDLHLIGGASSFLLDKSMISHRSPVAKTDLGEANNLNTWSFSGNLGLGVNYDISQQLEFNLEPIFKYQFNTFSRGEGLNPYIFGVYSGVRFKF